MGDQRPGVANELLPKGNSYGIAPGLPPVPWHRGLVALDYQRPGIANELLPLGNSCGIAPGLPSLYFAHLTSGSQKC